MENDFFRTYKGKELTGTAVNNDITDPKLRTLYIKCVVTDSGIELYKSNTEDKYGEPVSYSLSTKFKGSMVEGNRSFTMYSMGKVMSNNRLGKPSVFIRHFDDNGDIVFSIIDSKRNEYSCAIIPLVG